MFNANLPRPKYTNMGVYQTFPFLCASLLKPDQHMSVKIMFSRHVEIWNNGVQVTQMHFLNSFLIKEW